MNDAERFDAIRYFIAALKEQLERGGDPVPFDSRLFADVVAEQLGKGNAFAKRFPTYNAVDGRDCPTFQHGMTMAQAAGLITRHNPTYRFFSVQMPARLSRSVLSGLKDEADGAKDLARAYYKAFAQCFWAGVGKNPPQVFDDGSEASA